MADIPRIRQPYANITVPTATEGKTKPIEKLPTGSKDSKPARMDVILRGLIGAK